MAAEVFVDTGVWYGAANPRDPDHSACAQVLREVTADGYQAVTTNLVLAETHAMLLRWVNRGAGRAFLRSVRPGVVVVTSGAPIEERAVADWIERYDDQDFSLADAVSFAVMSERGIEEALTLDRHFRLAGFRTRPAR